MCRSSPAIQTENHESGRERPGSHAQRRRGAQHRPAVGVGAVERGEEVLGGTA